MDVLSEVLKVVRLDGAVFYNAEFSSPWSVRSPPSRVLASYLAERFRHYLGEPPMSYLTRWRLQLGAQMLSSSSYSVAQIASEVGYESEPAFNRAFKREFSLPPARFRTEAKAARKNRQSMAASR
jgi:transcriptional regulator GlxA family with amidase domain